VVFVCEDNDLAIHTFGLDRRGFKDKSIAAAARGFDCHVLEGDGTDVLVVLDIVRTALSLMMKDPKPVFLHFKWFRFLEHVGANTDFHVGYRPKTSEEELKVADPVYKYERFLLAQGFDTSQLEKIREELALQIEGSVERAKAAPYSTEEDLYKGVLA
jgi:TPP-dependent pyruvate/acetoin dehydrogenase alpha subunit